MLSSLWLDLGKLEYAARIMVNGRQVVSLGWPPWRVEIPFPDCGESLELEVVVTNTLAILLTSPEVEDWVNRKGPGWPGPFHEKTQGYEKDGRGGGLHGPVTLTGGYLT